MSGATGRYPQATVEPGEERLACMIVARNLGDAAIQSGVLKALAERGFARKYLAWTRPQMAFLFEDIPGCEIVCSQFPVGTTKQFLGWETVKFFRAVRAVRRCKPSVILDLVGDFRERIFARLTRAPRHIHIGWAEDHPHARIIRNPFGPGKPFFTVPASIPNVYTAYQQMLDTLSPRPQPQTEPEPPRGGPVARVGLHPFASQECKLWPEENWRSVVRELLARHVDVSAFAAPNERAALVSMLGGFAGRVNVVTVHISEFARQVSKLDVLVGLDSFSVHMAARLNVRSVLINAGNPPLLWAVPTSGSVILASSGGCKHYPCLNVPRCVGTAAQYACVRSIQVGEVMQAILGAEPAKER